MFRISIRRTRFMVRITITFETFLVTIEVPLLPSDQWGLRA